MAKIKIKDELGKERLHELIDDVTTVGRASINVIQVNDEKASRQHFRVEKLGHGFKLVDLGSTNGTRLNGNKITGEVPLKPGDQIALGKTTFTYDGPAVENGAAKEHQASAPVDVGGATVPIDSQRLEKETSPDAPKYVLKVLEGSNAGKTFELGTVALTIGRHASNTIQIIDDATSNYHAEVTREPMGYIVTDLGSTNGTRVKAKQGAEFEKVVKTSLSPGMQIRVGKTLLEFANVGKPVADDALFGTVALDPKKLSEKLDSQPRRGLPTPVLGILAALVFIGTAGTIIFLFKPPAEIQLPPVVEKQPDTSNRIANGDFSQGTDDDGNPRNFQSARAPNVKVAVVSEGDRAGKDKGLQITKAGRTGSALTAVETGASFPVEPGKNYEFSGWMRNDGDGLYGLRVVWMSGERTQAENPVVLKDTQEWKEKSVLLVPPAWAQRARAGVFVQGKEGKAYFDDLSFKEKPGAAPAPFPVVKFGAIVLTFEGSKGIFSGSAQGERVIEDGVLQLVSPKNQSISDITSALDPQIAQDATRASVQGRLYDFAAEDTTNFKLEAQPGAAGVDLSAAIDSASDSGSTPRLRFNLVGTVAAGDVELTKADGTSEKLLSTENEKTLSGVQEVLFNAAKTPQLDLLFNKPVEITLRREGNKRNVMITFKGELRLAFSPESVTAKKQMTTALTDLQSSIDARKWGEVESKAKTLRDGFGSKFGQAKDEAAKAETRLQTEWTNTQNDLKKLTENLDTPAAITAAEEAVKRHQAAWQGSERAAEVAQTTAVIEEKVKNSDYTKFVKEAEHWFAEAEKYSERKAHSVAKSILKVKILTDKTLNDPILKKLPIVKKAEEALARAETSEIRIQELKSVTDMLREKVKNHLSRKDFKGAIDAVEKTKEYQDNRDELKEINEEMKEWRKSAATQ